MIRVIRTVVWVNLPATLWEAIKNHAEIKGIKPVDILEVKAEELLKNPKPLPYNPARLVLRNADRFQREFSIVRTSVTIKADLLQRLLDVYADIVKNQFGKSGLLDVKSLVLTCFYYYGKEHGLSFNERYFDDKYFIDNFGFTDAFMIRSIQKLSKTLGRSPSAREWTSHRSLESGTNLSEEWLSYLREVGSLPSLQTVKKHFGSFNNLKEKAGLLKLTSGRPKLKKELE